MIPNGAGQEALVMATLVIFWILMRNILFALATLLSFAPHVASAQATVMVGGSPMYPAKTIVENAANSQDHTTLVRALKAAGLDKTLSETGPFTVFAPTNNAFAKLPNGTMATLLKPENKGTLTKILSYHVLAGSYSADKLRAAIKAGKGAALLTTVSGGKLTFRLNGATNMAVSDESGNTANIAIYDVPQSNGVIHVVDTVLLPK